MEKVIIPLWKHETTSAAAFRATLLDEVANQLTALPSVRHLTVCVVDEDVAPAEGYRMLTIFEQAYDAALLLWTDAVTHLPSYQRIFEPCTRRHCAYLVTEADQLPIDSPPDGSRSDGMNEIVFLQQPDRLTRDEWLDIWQGSHTQIAIDTQCTYGYRQNIVTRVLTQDTPPLDAIVEENFPDKALHSRAAFYDAENDEALYQEREKTMIESCARFIDFDRIDCIPTSEYRIL
jgi:hypothetical protein